MSECRLRYDNAACFPKLQLVRYRSIKFADYHFLNDVIADALVSISSAGGQQRSGRSRYLAHRFFPDNNADIVQSVTESFGF